MKPIFHQPAALQTPAEAPAIKGRSLRQDAWRRFKRNRAAVSSMVLLLLITLFVCIAPLLSPFAYDYTDWSAMQMPPSCSDGH